MLRVYRQSNCCYVCRGGLVEAKSKFSCLVRQGQVSAVLCIQAFYIISSRKSITRQHQVIKSHTPADNGM